MPYGAYRGKVYKPKEGKITAWDCLQFGGNGCHDLCHALHNDFDRGR